jgi:hypothetical protein
MYLSFPDKAGHYAVGTASGVMSAEFILLDGTFYYDDWSKLTAPTQLLGYTVRRDGLEVVVDFYSRGAGGGDLVGAYVYIGKERKDVPEKVDLSGPCAFAYVAVLFCLVHDKR